jgi:hypothetical protein
MLRLPTVGAASAAACALLLAAAPASAQRPQCAPGTEVRQSETPRQTAENQLRSAIIDTLHARLTDAAAEEGIDRPAGLVVVELASTREVRSVRVVRGNLPDPLIRQVLSEHGSLLSAWPDPVRVVAVRLDRPELPQENMRVECMPRLRNVHQLQSALSRVFSENRQFLPPYGSAVKLLMLVDRDGNVAHAAVPQLGTSGRLERAMIEAGYRLRFEPATVAGSPVEAWVEQPVHFPQRRP